jgi:hypothetical protein
MERERSRRQASRFASKGVSTPPDQTMNTLNSFTFGSDVVSRFLAKHDMDLICRAHQVGRITIWFASLRNDG